VGLSGTRSREVTIHSASFERLVCVNLTPTYWCQNLRVKCAFRHTRQQTHEIILSKLLAASLQTNAQYRVPSEQESRELRFGRLVPPTYGTPRLCGRSQFRQCIIWDLGLALEFSRWHSHKPAQWVEKLVIWYDSPERRQNMTINRQSKRNQKRNQGRCGFIGRGMNLLLDPPCGLVGMPPGEFKCQAEIPNCALAKFRSPAKSRSTISRSTSRPKRSSRDSCSDGTRYCALVCRGAASNFDRMIS
jgi:hypothetical protein